MIPSFYTYLSCHSHILFLVPDDLILFKLPRSHKPGEDRISKLIARHQSTVDMITTSLLGVKEGTYTSTNTTFTDGTECDVLYIPQSCAIPSLPPVIIEFQHSVTKSFMCRSIQYCINVFNRFKILPILLIFCINQVESKALADQFKPNSGRSYLLETPSNHFALYCYMITKESINSDVDNVNKEMNPIVAFAHFLLSGQQSIIGIDRWDDPTILKIYSIAKDIVTDTTSTEMKGIQALQTICKATHEQFVKISQHITSNPKRACQYSEAGRIYSENLKRKYDQLIELANAEESTTPMEEPDEITLTDQSLNQPSTASLVTFVDDYKKEMTGRMNWSHCWELGKKQGLFKEFGNGNSLKAVYYRAKKLT